MKKNTKKMKKKNIRYDSVSTIFFLLTITFFTLPLLIVVVQKDAEIH